MYFTPTVTLSQPLAEPPFGSFCLTYWLETLNWKFCVIVLSHSYETVLTFMLSPLSSGVLIWPNCVSNSSSTPGSSTVIVAGKIRSPTTAWAEAAGEPARQAAPAAAMKATRAGAACRFKSVRMIFFLSSCPDQSLPGCAATFRDCSRSADTVRLWIGSGEDGGRARLGRAIKEGDVGCITRDGNRCPRNR